MKRKFYHKSKLLNFTEFSFNDTTNEDFDDIAGDGETIRLLSSTSSQKDKMDSNYHVMDDDILERYDEIEGFV